MTYDFHGCMLGTTDQEGNPIKKPWTVATSMSEIGESLVQFQCDGNHTHVQGRGKPLKNTESYTFQFTDVVHKAFHRAATSARKLASALPAIRLCVIMASSAAADVGVASHSEEQAVVAGMDKSYETYQDQERLKDHINDSCGRAPHSSI